jgi:predicted small lipoprotein YifL
MLHSKISYQTPILIVKSCLAFYIAAAVALSGALAGCGQPGPLYMPKPPAKPAAAAPAPVVPALPASPATPPMLSPSTVPASPQ